MDGWKMQDAESRGVPGAAVTKHLVLTGLSPWGSTGTPPLLSSPQFPPAQLGFSNW